MNEKLLGWSATEIQGISLPNPELLTLQFHIIHPGLKYEVHLESLDAVKQWVAETMLCSSEHASFEWLAAIAARYGYQLTAHNYVGK